MGKRNNIKKAKTKIAPSQKTEQISKNKAFVFFKTIINSLRSIYFWTISGVIVAIIAFGYTIYYNYQKDARKIDTYIGAYPITDYNMIFYICPTSEIGMQHIEGTLPLTFINKSSNNIDNFMLDIISNVKETYENGHIKTKIKVDVPWNEQITQCSRNSIIIDNRPGVRYLKTDFNSQLALDLYETFRIDTSTLNIKTSDGYYTTIKDIFALDLVYLYKNIKKTFYSTLKIIVINYKNTDEFFHDLDNLSSLPDYPYYIDENMKIKTCKNILLISPIYKFNKTGGYYKADSENMEINRIEYTSDNFYKNRKLTVYDENNNIIKMFHYKDISKTNENFDKKVKQMYSEMIKNESKE